MRALKSNKIWYGQIPYCKQAATFTTVGLCIWQVTQEHRQVSYHVGNIPRQLLWWWGFTDWSNIFKKGLQGQIQVLKMGKKLQFSNITLRWCKMPLCLYPLSVIFVKIQKRLMMLHFKFGGLYIFAERIANSCLNFYDTQSKRHWIWTECTDPFIFDVRSNHVPNFA